MQVMVTRISRKSQRFDAARRNLVKIAHMLNMCLGKLQQLDGPKERDEKWVWTLVFPPTATTIRKHPVMFIVDQNTGECSLEVVRKNKDEIVKWELKLPHNLREVKAEEVFKHLGF